MGEMVGGRHRQLPLSGLTVIDVSTLFAGPLAAGILGDFGADVIKVEHPKGDPLRSYGPMCDDFSLAWKVVNRNKKSILLDLHEPGDRDAFLRLSGHADVVIENFRPGTLEKWGLGADVLTARNPRLVLTRVTAFGQDGPYADRPGFGTLAEAMSGLAAMSGEADGPPLLPAFPLGDAVAGLNAVCAVLMALRARDRLGNGQVADVSITESLLGLLGFQIAAFDKTGASPVRQGNRSANSAPRNVYRCSDGTWVAVSASARSVAERVMRLIGRAELIDEPWFAAGRLRARHHEVDRAVAEWIAERDRPSVIAAFRAAQAAVAPVYEFSDVLADPHFTERGSVIEVPDEDIGSVRMPGPAFRLSGTPGRVLSAGPRPGQHAKEVLSALGTDRVEPRVQAHR